MPFSYLLKCHISVLSFSKLRILRSPSSLSSSMEKKLSRNGHPRIVSTDPVIWQALGRGNVDLGINSFFENVILGYYKGIEQNCHLNHIQHIYLMLDTKDFLRKGLTLFKEQIYLCYWTYQEPMILNQRLYPLNKVPMLVGFISSYFFGSILNFVFVTLVNKGSTVLIVTTIYSRIGTKDFEQQRKC